MANLHYIVGSRQSGKTHQLLNEYYKYGMGHILTLTAAMGRRIKHDTFIGNQKHTHFGVAKDFKSMGDDLPIFADDLSYYDYQTQQYIILQSEFRPVYAVIATREIDMNNLPPFWLHWAEAKVTVLQAKQNPEISSFLPPRNVVTELEGYFIIKP